MSSKTQQKPLFILLFIKFCDCLHFCIVEIMCVQLKALINFVFNTESEESVIYGVSVFPCSPAEDGLLHRCRDAVLCWGSLSGL